MADFLDKLDIKDVSKEESSTVRSLESLLLLTKENEAAETLQKADGLIKDSEDPGSRSRKSRRKKIRSNRVVSATSKDNELPSEQVRLTQEYQEKNKKALLKREKQSNQPAKSGSGSRLLQSSKLISRNKSNKSNVLAVVKRPVILASFDYLPLFHQYSSSKTTVGNLIDLRRSAKKMKIDKIVRPVISNTQFETPEIADRISKYSDTKSQFLDALSPSSISGYSDMLSAFGLTLSNNISNSEMIYTFMSELAHSAKYSSSRLDESSDRTIGVDSKNGLVESKDKVIERYYGALKVDARYTDAFWMFRDADSDDIEIATKCLLTILAKEITCSYNISKKELKARNIDPLKVLQTKSRPNILSHPVEMADPAYRAAHGTVFESISEDGLVANRLLNYPFEKSQVIQKNELTRSSFDFVAALASPGTEKYKTLTSSTFETPYKAVSDSFGRATTSLVDLMDSQDLSSTRSVSVELMNNIIGKLHTSLTDSIENTDAAIQCNILNAAGTSSAIFADLLIYLAFRSEKVYGVETETDGASETIIYSQHLRALVGAISTGKVKKSFSIKPQDVTLDPAVDGESSFTAPSKPTTATLETTPSSSETSSLESRFDITFEEICTMFSQSIQEFFSANGTSQPVFTVDKTVVAMPTSIYSCLTNTATQGSIFDYLLQFDDALHMNVPNDDDISIFSQLKKTKFSNIPRRNIFTAFSLVVSKLASVLMSSRSRVTSPSNSTPEKTPVIKTKSSKPKSTLTSKFGGFGATSFDVGGFSAATTPIIIQDVFIKMQTSADFAPALLDLESYLSNEDIDFTDITDSYPVIASIGSSILQEESLVSTVALSLDQYFKIINHSFEEIRQVLDEPMADNTTLRQRMLSGLVPSIDSAKLLKSYSYSFNDANMIYNNSKIKDKTIGPGGIDMLLDHCRIHPSFLQNKKAFVIGIPAGLLEEVSSSPAEIEYIETNSSTSQPDIFSLKIQKIDQTNPDLEYSDVDIKFSRSLFLVGSERAVPKFAVIGTGLDTKDLTATSTKNNFGMDVYNNHVSSVVLKQYADSLLDLDFYESAFPINRSYRKAALSGEVDITAFSLIDSSTAEFLSSSNLAFDKNNRNIEQFSFYNKDKKTIDISQNPTDQYAFAVMDYLNSYGSFFIPEIESSKMADSLQFERILCVLVGDDDFVMNDTTSEISRSKKVQVDAMLTEQKAVGVGVETSSGVDLNTYRFLVTVDEA